MHLGGWVLAASLLVAVGGTAQAQFNQPSSGSAGGGGGGGGAAFRQAVDKGIVIKDLSFEIKALVRDPATEGYKIIVEVTEKGSNERRVAFVQPQASLIDDFGNVYLGSNAAGIQICEYNPNAWDEIPRNCAGRSIEDLTTLAPSIPYTVSMSFVPKPDGVIPDAAASATKANFKARLIVIAEKKWYTVDVSLPDIQLPR